MNKLVLLASYLLLLPSIILILSLYSLFLLHSGSFKKTVALSDPSKFQVVVAQNSEYAYTTQKTEARVEVLQRFFTRYNSPLLSYAKLIVDTADKYSLDWRLIPAIAMQESNLCLKIPKNSYNCWGFGIYSGKVKRFANFNQAIETVTKTLAVEYKDRLGLEEPHEIVTRYTPGNSTWTDGVNFFIDKIQASL